MAVRGLVFPPCVLVTFSLEIVIFSISSTLPLCSVLLSLFWHGLVPSGPSFWVSCGFPRAGFASSSLRKLIGLMKATNLDRLAFFALLLFLCCSAPGFLLPFFEFQSPSPLVGSLIYFLAGVSAYQAEILGILWLAVRMPASSSLRKLMGPMKDRCEPIGRARIAHVFLTI